MALIFVKDATKEFLDKNKIIKRETYDDVINRLINIGAKNVSR
jgi:hypothetical protein